MNAGTQHGAPGAEPTQPDGAGSAGTLILAAAPIGTPQDASGRLSIALASAQVIAAEDTRRLRRLAAALGPKYDVRGLLGRGGFAEVYEVWDRELERRLAVKVLRPDIAWTPGMLQRFRQETKAVARLSHPNVLAIHFVGEGQDIVYYAMPFVEGESLADLLRREGPLAPERVTALARAVLDALQHAHDMGLLHRDIKPENIMIERASGKPLLVDFGIAKRLDVGKGVTQTGFVVGTPQYMSPEQATAEKDITARRTSPANLCT